MAGHGTARLVNRQCPSCKYLVGKAARGGLKLAAARLVIMAEKPSRPHQAASPGA